MITADGGQRHRDTGVDVQAAFSLSSVDGVNDAVHVGDIAIGNRIFGSTDGVALDTVTLLPVGNQLTSLTAEELCPAPAGDAPLGFKNAEISKRTRPQKFPKMRS